MSLISEYERFERSHFRRNPAGEASTEPFVQHLADQGKLLSFDEGAWVELGERLNMTDDQIGGLLESISTWVPEEPVPPSKQEPADWPDEVPGRTGNSAPVTRGNPSKHAPEIAVRRGTDEFDALMEEMLDEWEVEEEILEDIVELRRCEEEDSFEYRLKGHDEFELLTDEDDDEDAGDEEPGEEE